MSEVQGLNDRQERAWRALRFMQMRLEGELARQLAATSRLSYPDYLVLVALTDEPTGRMRPVELGRVLGWEKSRLSHHISRMADRGLVEKKPNDDDRRGALVAVTSTGRRQIKLAAPRHLATVRRLFADHLTDAQLDTITEAAETILAALNATADPHGAETTEPRRP